LIFHGFPRTRGDGSIAADVIGGRRIKKASATYNRLGMRTSTQAQEKDEHWITPFELMQLQPFVAVLKHAQGGFARLLMPPLDDTGQISERYLTENSLNFLAATAFSSFRRCRYLY